MAAPRQSALGMALNGKSASVGIPRGWDTLTGAPTTDGKLPDVLPTPPSSISPNLAPHRHSQGPRSSTASNHQESDLDIQDAPRNALNAEALDRLGALESAGAITPAMLSRDYLPGILLNNGPLAIRHIMGFLTTSLPGFSRIPSARARRLVVAALEGRGNTAEGAGPNGDVIFEKVGWGRWDARRKGQPPREQPHGITPPSSYSTGGIQMVDKRSWRNGSDNLGTSIATSAGFSHSDDYHDMIEHEADKMSMDDDDEEDGYQSSEAPEPMDLEMGEGDETDEEDWQSLGAEALKARSLPRGSMPGGGNLPGRLYQPVAYTTTRYRSKTPGLLAKSAPSRPAPARNFSIPNYNFPSGMDDSQERAAVEALLSLGSM